MRRKRSRALIVCLAGVGHGAVPRLARKVEGPETQPAIEAAGGVPAVEPRGAKAEPAPAEAPEPVLRHSARRRKDKA